MKNVNDKLLNNDGKGFYIESIESDILAKYTYKYLGSRNLKNLEVFIQAYHVETITACKEHNPAVVANVSLVFIYFHRIVLQLLKTSDCKEIETLRFYNLTEDKLASAIHDNLWLDVEEHISYCQQAQDLILSILHQYPYDTEMLFGTLEFLHAVKGVIAESYGELSTNNNVIVAA